MTLTAEQAEVVARIKATDEWKRAHARKSPSWQAARHAYETGCRFLDAAKLFGVSESIVARRYRVLFPDNPRPRGGLRKETP